MRCRNVSVLMISFEVRCDQRHLPVSVCLLTCAVCGVEQPSEWRPLLDTLKDLQAFSNFLDDRIALNKLDRGMLC